MINIFKQRGNKSFIKISQFNFMVYMYQKYSWLTRCFAYFSGYMITLWLSIFCNAVIAQLLFKISSFDASDKCVCQFFISDNNLGFFLDTIFGAKI